MRKAAWLGVCVLCLAIAWSVWHFRVPRGNVQTVTFDSKAAGGARKMLVYLPPGYSGEVKYPVLYLLGGVGDDETAWSKQGSAPEILDDLRTKEKIVPMIVVMPNAQGRGSGYETDLLQDVIPFVESHYAVRAEREGRAIAGLSLGGGQALRIGLNHPDTFAWVGGFAPSLSGKSPDELFADPTDFAEKLTLLWISCGNEDQLLELGRSLHETLEAKKVPHKWHVGSGGHEWSVWRDDLRRFVQLLFRE